MISIFRDFQNITEPNYLTIDQTLDRIRSGKSKKAIEAIRLKVATNEDYENDKKALPCVLFSASKLKSAINRKDHETFREDGCVAEHSGFFTLDWDKCDTTQKIEQLKKDPYIYAVWLSVTGKGVRALVKCPPSIENHNLYYTAFLDRYAELDPTSRNISRVTFESYDPSLWVNQGSLVWDKKLSEDARRANKEKEANRRGKSVISTAVGMIRSAVDGEKHETLLKASCLVGGYIAAGRIKEEEAVKILEDEIKHKSIKDFPQAQKTIGDGIAHGKNRPLAEAKKIEKAQQFLRREDGSYDFLADDAEMTEYELAVINGTLEMGLPTGFNRLNEHWMFKRHHLVWIGAIDNVGKSFIVWYLSVLAAKLHGWKIVLNSNENGDGQLRKKLKEFYMGKSIKMMDDEELTIAHDWVKDHFRIITSKQMNSIEDLLMKAEILYDEGFEFQVLVADPFNSYDFQGDNMHLNNMRALNAMRVFKENYAAIWVCDHVNSTAARKKDKEGYVEAPWKSDIEYGQLKASKVDDFLMLHRVVNHPFKKDQLEIHVHKIKDKETGGSHTTKDDPVLLLLNKNYCGFTCNGVDPIRS